MMHTKKKKIFVADDDEDIVQILSLMLQTKGYQVQTSRDASEILSFQSDNLPDLVLLDIWMSGVDGRDICSQLKSNVLTSQIPVLFISANSNIRDITRDSNADGYIAKPFEMNDMLETVEQMLYPTRIAH
jgi:DNA-binding response OmpR family regulator